MPCDWSLTVSLSGQRVAAMRRRRSTSCSSATLTRKGRIASAVAAAAICDGNSLAAPATAMPIAALFKSRRRPWLISSYVLIVFIDKSPCFEDSCVAISRCAGANEFHLISPPAILDQRAQRHDDVLRTSAFGADIADGCTVRPGVVAVLIRCPAHAGFFNTAGSTGILRRRFPVAANIALAMAGTTADVPVSPTPPCGRLTLTH